MTDAADLLFDNVPLGAPTSAARKRKKRVTPKERCLRECRRRGWTAGDVERRIPFPRPRGTTFDLFGVIDLVAIVPAEELHGYVNADGSPQYRAAHMIGIQACPGARHADHRVKILAEPRAREWLAVPGNQLELWSWSKRGSHFERARWELRVEAFTLDSAWSSPQLGEVAEDPDGPSDDPADGDQRDQQGDEHEQP